MAIQADSLKIFQSTDVIISFRDIRDANDEIINWHGATIRWGLTRQEGAGDLLLLKKQGEDIVISKDGLSFAVVLNDNETQLPVGKYYHEIKAQSPAGQDVQVLAPSLFNVVSSALAADTASVFLNVSEYQNPAREFTGKVTEVWRKQEGPIITAFRILSASAGFEVGSTAKAEISTDAEIDLLEIEILGQTYQLSLFDYELAGQILAKIRVLNLDIQDINLVIAELESKKEEWHGIIK